MEKNTLESALKEFSQTSGTNANDVKEFFALMSDGSIKRMPKEDMATVLGELMGYGKEIYTTGGTSFLLLDTTSAAITCSLLISVSQSQSGRPNLYSVEINRAAGSTSTPNISIKVLSGTYAMKLAQKTDDNGRFQLFVKRTAYTPVIWAKILTQYGVGKGLLVTAASEGDLQDAVEIEAT
jgi:hypothetical protein